MRQALAVYRPKRPCGFVCNFILWMLFLSHEQPTAVLGSNTTSPQHRQSWLTLYGPLRLGVNEDDDNLALSALGTWLRLDCPAGEDGLPGRFQPALDALPANDDVRNAGQAVWPMPTRTSAATPPDILFFTDDQGETCNRLQAALGLDQQHVMHWEDMRTRVRCLNECVHPYHRRLNMACIIEHASKTVRTPVMSLINSDIALGADFVRTMQGLFFSQPAAGQPDDISSDIANNNNKNKLVVGRRTDLNLPTPRIDFEETNWVTALHSLATANGRLHSKYGIDYLVTGRPGIWAQPSLKTGENPPGSSDNQADQRTTPSLEDKQPFFDMPPFLVGVWRWDSFVLARAILSPSIVVVDATPAVVAMHLQHAAAGEPPQHRRRRGAAYCDRLVHDLIGRRYLMGHVLNADYEVTVGGEFLARVDAL